MREDESFCHSSFSVIGPLSRSVHLRLVRYHLFDRSPFVLQLYSESSFVYGPFVSRVSGIPEDVGKTKLTVLLTKHDLLTVLVDHVCVCKDS